jgi:LPXTG-site transpeptidase (sortase) family protein
MAKKQKGNSLPVNKKSLVSLYREALVAGVSLEDLDRKVEKFAARKQLKKEFEQEVDETFQDKLWGLPRIWRKVSAALPIFLMILGMGLALSALWPILSHYLPKTSGSDLLSPISEAHPIEAKTNIVYAQKLSEESYGQAEVLDEPVISSKGLDYSDLRNWFAEDTNLEADSEDSLEEYRIDIPSLKVSNAMVRVGGTDLNKNLIQYPGTALPGQQGAPVIFGHSVLRQFYNPSEKNSKRYGSIFSTIMTLKEGDEIFVTYKNVKYTYRVVSHTEVKPTDTFILAQRYDARQLKLVTCVPEGTTLRRGVVTAELIK